VKRHECVAYSLQTMLGKYKHHGHSEGDIFVVTDMEHIQEHYSDNMMPMKLRLLGERVYGTAPFPCVQ
jgi:hypothetical protein